MRYIALKSRPLLKACLPVCNEFILLPRTLIIYTARLLVCGKMFSEVSSEHSWYKGSKDLQVVGSRRRTVPHIWPHSTLRLIHLSNFFNSNFYAAHFTVVIDCNPIPPTSTLYLTYWPDPMCTKVISMRIALIDWPFISFCQAKHPQICPMLCFVTAPSGQRWLVDICKQIIVDTGSRQV